MRSSFRQVYSLGFPKFSKNYHQFSLKYECYGLWINAELKETTQLSFWSYLSVPTLLMDLAEGSGHAVLATLRVSGMFLEFSLRLMFQRKHYEKH